MTKHKIQNKFKYQNLNNKTRVLKFDGSTSLTINPERSRRVDIWILDLFCALNFVVCH